MDLFDQTDSGAIFSDCKKYRYMLWRIWDKDKDYVMFIGLNPSTANELKDDPTIRRIKKIAFNLGYGGVYMLNLYPFITPHPELLKFSDEHTDTNERWLTVAYVKCKDVIFAWGSFPEAEKRAKQTIIIFNKAYALEINKDGSPKHPLYVRSDVKPVVYK